jgi:hypothetical protein
VAGVAALAEPPRGGYPPDPPGHASRKQWVFDVTYTKGRASMARSRAATREQPAATARVLGRFAIELYVGPQLLDRVRFNVPLTGDDRDPAGAESDPERRKRNKRPFARPGFENLTTRMRVQMADHPRAAWVQLVDRATGTTDRFWWPPEPDGTLLPMRPAGDGGTDARDGSKPVAPKPRPAPQDAGPG